MDDGNSSANININSNLDDGNQHSTMTEIAEPTSSNAATANDIIPHHFQHKPSSSSSPYTSSGPMRTPWLRSGVRTGGWIQDETSRRVSDEQADNNPRYPEHDLESALAQSTMVQSELQANGGHAVTTASLAVVSLVAYAFYHASLEALVDETGAAWAGARSTPIGTGLGPLRALGDNANIGIAPEIKRMNGIWGPGVSLITVSAWHSLAALGAGFVASRVRKVFSWRKAEVRMLTQAERVSPLASNDLLVQP